jgi:hypothetical protein
MKRVSDSDLPEILHWFKKRNLVIPPKWLFSDEGFIVPRVAAGFLYLTNSGIARMDCFISNPDVSKADRADALEAIANRILYVARHEHKVKMISCDTKIKSIQTLAESLGFKISGEHVGFYKIL